MGPRACVMAAGSGLVIVQTLSLVIPAGSAGIYRAGQRQKNRCLGFFKAPPQQKRRFMDSRLLP
ncbi:MAG: hypothetical protein [Olavius algarvensis Gamma 1 endosymbiont]|nr:MAG: hypothetical protein [Olavius algarvensis Gamma 1 endosymbiont]